MLKLVQTDWGQFDLALDDAAAEDDSTALATLVYAVLFTDAEAPAGRVSDSFDRRGWHEDPQAGSGLWHVRRQPLNSAARREALDMVQGALMEKAPALTDVVVTEVAAGAGAGSVSGLTMEITGKHNGRKFVLRTPP